MVTLFGIGERVRGVRRCPEGQAKLPCGYWQWFRAGCKVFGTRNADGQRMASFESCDSKHPCSQGSVRPRIENIYYYGSLLGDPGPVTHSLPNLPHKVLRINYESSMSTGKQIDETLFPEE